MLTHISETPEITRPNRRYMAYRLTIFRRSETRPASHSSGARFSLSALAFILVITFLWSHTVDAVFFSGDAITYFKMLADGSWIDSYRLQPTMFLTLALIRPHTFEAYIFCSDAIPLTIMLYAFHRLKYSRIDQLLLIVFFSCSFYGVHFLLDFQRQFYAIAFFMLAVSIKRGSVPARIASIGAHAFSFTLHALWGIRKLRVRTAVLLCIPAIPAIYLLTGIIDADKMADYTAFGGASTNLLIKQFINLFYVLVILLTLQQEGSDLRTMSYVYICTSLPCLFWAGYRGVFARVDYYFFPALIAFWPGAIDEKRRWMCRAVIICSTILGFYLWVRMNFAWIINGAG
jgi:hypothetical protein